MTPSWREWRLPSADQALFTENFATSPGLGLEKSTSTILSLVQPSDYYLLLIFYVGTNDVMTRRLKLVKDFKTLGRWLKDSLAQVVFFSVLTNGKRWKETGEPRSLLPGSKTCASARILGFIIILRGSVAFILLGDFNFQDVECHISWYSHFTSVNAKFCTWERVILDTGKDWEMSGWRSSCVESCSPCRW